MKRLIIILALTATLAGCYKSEIIYPTPAEPKQISVDITHIDGNSDSTIPEGYTLVLNDDEFSVSDDSATELDVDLDPGDYTLYVYSHADDITIDNGINQDGAGTITFSAPIDSSGATTSLSEDIYFGTEYITVLKDEIIYSEVFISQITRTIKFNLQIIEGDVDSITDVAASLSGMASQWECVQNVPLGDAIHINPVFTQGESLAKSTSVNNYLTSSIKILGIHGNEQILTLELTYIDGTTQTITSDVSSELEGSNDTKSTTITLSADLNALSSSSHEDATIDDWTQESGGSHTVD